jgi:hypothetical protein
MRTAGEVSSGYAAAPSPISRAAGVRQVLAGEVSRNRSPTRSTFWPQAVRIWPADTRAGPLLRVRGRHVGRLPAQCAFNAGTASILRLKRLCRFPPPGRLGGPLLRPGPNGERPPGMELRGTYGLHDFVTAPAMFGRELHLPIAHSGPPSVVRVWGNNGLKA